KRTGMNRLAFRLRPTIHHPRTTNARRHREAAGHSFAEAHEIRHDVPMLARKPPARTAEAGVDFVEDQHKPVPVTKPSQRGQEIGRRYDDAAASLNRLDD